MKTAHIIYQHHTAICRKKNPAVRNLQNTGGQLEHKLIMTENRKQIPNLSVI